jgi:hypothetical protein
MRRRDFIAGLGGAAALPLAANAQERVRRIGVLMSTGAGDRLGQARLAAFVQGMQEFGWADSQRSWPRLRRRSSWRRRGRLASRRARSTFAMPMRSGAR